MKAGHERDRVKAVTEAVNALKVDFEMKSSQECVRCVAMQAKQEELVTTLAVARRIYEQERDRAGDLASRLASSDLHDGRAALERAVVPRRLPAAGSAVTHRR